MTSTFGHSRPMRDDEYPAYLKTQSYDDLVSICDSIDQEASGKRYQIALAEIAERDARTKANDKEITPILEQNASGVSETDRSWFDRAFFVKERKPKIVILWFVMTATFLCWIWLRVTNPFAVSGYVTGLVLRYVICIALSLATMFIASGGYNLMKYLKAKFGFKEKESSQAPNHTTKPASPSRAGSR